MGGISLAKDLTFILSFSGFDTCLTLGHILLGGDDFRTGLNWKMSLPLSPRLPLPPIRTLTPPSPHPTHISGLVSEQESANFNEECPEDEKAPRRSRTHSGGGRCPSSAWKRRPSSRIQPGRTLCASSRIQSGWTLCASSRIQSRWTLCPSSRIQSRWTLCTNSRTQSR